MQKKTLGYLACVTLVLAGCGRVAESRLNPGNWFGNSRQVQTLEPEGGYPTIRQDSRMLMAQVTGARWEPLNEGRLLVVTGLGQTKGWWNVDLVTEQAMPRGRIRADEFGVLRLRLVGHPPAPDSFESANPPNPASDTATVAMTLPTATLSGLREVVITSGGNVVTLRP